MFFVFSQGKDLELFSCTNLGLWLKTITIALCCKTKINDWITTNYCWRNHRVYYFNIWVRQGKAAKVPCASRPIEMSWYQKDSLWRNSLLEVPHNNLVAPCTCFGEVPIAKISNPFSAKSKLNVCFWMDF